MTMPAIPENLPPAPRPKLADVSDLSGSAMRYWQDGKRARQQYAYEDGPTICKFSGETWIDFPTFGYHPEQSRILRAAGYGFASHGAGWVKTIAPADAERELEWARRLYMALHPTWKRA